MKIIYSPKCAGYNFPGHPESPKRVITTYELLKKSSYEFIEPFAADIEDILAVHDAELIQALKNNDFLEQETPNNSEMFYYAELAAGGAILALEYALKGEDVFSLMRPPGHHATRNKAQGYCYLNNIAIAVKKGLNFVKKIAILDIDCHHGNGTEDIFRNQENVLFVSLHASPCYPETGLVSYKNCINYPLPLYTKEDQYLATLEKALLKIKEFSPELLAISAGFDTYKNDPVTEFGLEQTSYAKISAMISTLNIRTFSILEGGYSDDLSTCISYFLENMHCVQ